MSVVAIGLFVLACGWNVYRLFLPTKAAALRAEGHPQYFGAALAAGYIAFLAVFLHAAFAGKVHWYSTALDTLVKLAPKVDDDDDKKSGASGASVPASVHIDRLTIESRGVIRSGKPQAMEKPKAPKTTSDPYVIAVAVGIWSALLGLVLPWFLNLPFVVNKRANLLAGLKSSNEVEEALLDALTRETSIAITLTNGKVYVGFPSEFDPNGDEPDWVKIWPLASGYRTRKGRLHLTTSYGPAYEELSDAAANQTDSNAALNSKKLSPDAFKITLPVEHIASIQTFSLKFYIEHFAQQADSTQTKLGKALASEIATHQEKPSTAKPNAVQVNPISTEAYKRVVPDELLRTLKWGFHLALTAAVVSAPFSLAVTVGATLVAGLLLFVMSDPTDKHLQQVAKAVGKGLDYTPF